MSVHVIVPVVTRFRLGTWWSGERHAIGRVGLAATEAARRSWQGRGRTFGGRLSHHPGAGRRRCVVRAAGVVLRLPGRRVVGVRRSVGAPRGLVEEAG